MTALTTSSKTYDNDYIPRDDISEQQRLLELGGYPTDVSQEDIDDFAQTMGSLGLHVRDQ
jgi:hypothetical protein